ncbi:hypothetical protein [Halorhabdus amylolytica]|uniref:hypothetical protein n=1 Tax=Halorhabdus amylolytica TaxID=2559573 RepID=UPI0010A9FFC5|nr:hypothetical protein [Halorhabdus amylolytica]
MALLLGLSGIQLFGLGLGVAGLLVLTVSVRYVWRATAVLRAQDVDSIDSLDSGTLVRVSGTIESIEDPITTPFSGTDCAVLRYGIEERRLSPYLLPWFVTIHERTAAHPFTLRTATGTVAVVEAVRTVTLEKKVVATVGADEEPPERIADFQRSVSGAPGWTIWRDPPQPFRRLARTLSLGRRRYLEQRAIESDRVTAVGRVAEDGLDPIVVSDRSPTDTLVRMAKTSLAGVLIGGGTLSLAILLLVI